VLVKNKKPRRRTEMGWLDLAVAPPVRWNASGMPDATPPLKLSEETAAQNTLRTYPVRAIPSAKPTRVVKDILRSGLTPGSVGVTLATRDGVSLEEAMDSVDAVSEDLELSPRLVLDALLADDGEVPSEEAILEAVNGPRSLEAIERELYRDLITRVNEQLADARSGIRTAAKAPVGVERKSKGAPRTASGGPRPDRRFKPDGKKRKGSGGISTTPTTREHVREGTASLRSIAEAYQSIRQKRGAA
jgi:hypothetical protein